MKAGIGGAAATLHTCRERRPPVEAGLTAHTPCRPGRVGRDTVGLRVRAARIMMYHEEM